MKIKLRRRRLAREATMKLKLHWLQQIVDILLDCSTWIVCNNKTL